MTEEHFEIKLPQFEGPFDLLLFFIERDELDIHEISIAKITDDFLDYLHHMQQLNMELASEFIYVAATLMRIKAKMLLPRHELDEDGNEIDPKEDLIRKLIEYKKFKLICEELKPLEDERFKREKRGNIHMDMEASLCTTSLLPSLRTTRRLTQHTAGLDFEKRSLCKRKIQLVRASSSASTTLMCSVVDRIGYLRTALPLAYQQRNTANGYR